MQTNSDGPQGTDNRNGEMNGSPFSPASPSRPTTSPVALVPPEGDASDTPFNALTSGGFAAFPRSEPDLSQDGDSVGSSDVGSSGVGSCEVDSRMLGDEGRTSEATFEELSEVPMMDHGLGINFPPLMYTPQQQMMPQNEWIDPGVGDPVDAGRPSRAEGLLDSTATAGEDGEAKASEPHDAASQKMDEVLRRSALFKGIRLRWLLFFLIVLVTVLVVIFIFQFLHFTNDTILTTGRNNVFEKTSNVLGNTELLIVELITFFTSIQRFANQTPMLDELCTRLGNSPMGFAIYNATTLELTREWLCPGYKNVYFEKYIPAMRFASPAVQIVGHTARSVLAFMRPIYAPPKSPVIIQRDHLHINTSSTETKTEATALALPDSTNSDFQLPDIRLVLDDDIICAVLMDKNMVGRLLLSNFDAQYSAATLMETYETFVARMWNATGMEVLLHTLTDSTPTYSSISKKLRESLFTTFDATCGNPSFVWHTVLHVARNYTLFATRNMIPEPRLQYGSALGLLSSVTLCSVVCIEEDYDLAEWDNGTVKGNCEYNDPTNFWFMVEVEEFGQRYGIIIVLVIGIVSIVLFSAVMGVVYLSVVVPVGFMRHQLFRTVGAQKPLVQWKRNLYQCSYPFWIGDISSLTSSLHVLGISFNLNKKYVPDHILRKHAKDMDLMCRKFKALDLFDPFLGQDGDKTGLDDEATSNDLEDVSDFANLNMEGVQKCGNDAGSGNGGPLTINGLANLSSEDANLHYSQNGSAGLMLSVSEENGGCPQSLGGSVSGAGVIGSGPNHSYIRQDSGYTERQTHASGARELGSSAGNSEIDRTMTPENSLTGLPPQGGPYTNQSFATPGNQGRGTAMHVEVDLLGGTTKAHSHTSNPSATMPPARQKKIRLPPDIEEGGMTIKRAEDATIMVVRLESIDAIYLVNYAVASRQHRRMMRYLLARIRHWGGAVFHRSGDCLAAAWNAFDTCPNHVVRAASCGMEIVDAFAAYRSVGLMVGVVVHAGMFICGIIEDAKEAFSTAFGSAAREALQLAALVAAQSTFGLIVTEPVKQATSGLYDSIIVDVVKQDEDMHPIVLFQLNYRQNKPIPGIEQGTVQPYQRFMIQYAKVFAHFIQHEFKECIRLLERVKESSPREVKGQLLRLEMLSAYFDTHPSEAPPLPYYRPIPSWSNYEKRAFKELREHQQMGGSTVTGGASLMRGQSSFQMSNNNSMLQRNRINGRQLSSTTITPNGSEDGRERSHLIVRPSSSSLHKKSLKKEKKSKKGTKHAQLFPEAETRISLSAQRGTPLQGKEGVNELSGLDIPNFSIMSNSSSTRDLGTLLPAHTTAPDHIDEEDFKRELQDNIRRVGRSSALPEMEQSGSVTTFPKTGQNEKAEWEETPQTPLDLARDVAFRTKQRINVQHFGGDGQKKPEEKQFSSESSNDGKDDSKALQDSNSNNGAGSNSTKGLTAQGTMLTQSSSLANGMHWQPTVAMHSGGQVLTPDPSLPHVSPSSFSQFSQEARPSMVSEDISVPPSSCVPLSSSDQTPENRYVDPQANGLGGSPKMLRDVPSFSVPSMPASSTPPTSNSTHASSNDEGGVNLSSPIVKQNANSAGTSPDEPQSRGSSDKEDASPPPVSSHQDQEVIENPAIACSIIQSIGLTLPSTFNGSSSSVKGSSVGMSSLRSAPSSLPSQILAKNGILYQRSDRILGSGSFGSVYLGMDVRSGKLVAIKVLPLPTREAEGSSVEAEALIMRVKDPHVVEFISYAFQEQSIVIIMECMLAGSLQNMLTSFKALPPFTAKAFIRDVLRGLNKLHSMDVVHRDVKPQNVLLTPAGNCKITDFGASAELAKQAHGQAVHGTPVYLAPEAARGNPVKVSDIWSCGIMYIQLVTGALPYPQEKLQLPVEVLVFQIGARIATPVIPDTLDELEFDFISACLEPDAEKRRSASRLLQSPMFAL